MNDNEFIKILRECDGHLIPSGDEIKLKKGTQVKITQSLGGDFTLYVNGNLVKIRGKDADAIGQKIKSEIKNSDIKKFDEKYIWDVLKTCYDPEIPVNIVDLGLVYDLKYHKNDLGNYEVTIKMTLTAPGCGMGPVIAQDVESKVLNLNFVADVLVEVVWEPLWNQNMMSEEAQLKLGML
jgi:probable FeS assembly SUF system protein SufT